MAHENHGVAHIKIMHLLFRGIRWLIIPLSLFLWLQWPLRELVHAYSREVNDLAQMMFAIYGAVAVSAATLQGRHLRATGWSASPFASDTHAALRVLLAAACVVPWAMFALWTFGGSVWQSVWGFERFPETFNPGYFVLKLAVILLYVLVLVQALGAVFRCVQAKVGRGSAP